MCDGSSPDLVVSDEIVRSRDGGRMRDGIPRSVAIHVALARLAPGGQRPVADGDRLVRHDLLFRRAVSVALAAADTKF
jgi:hypothetical protein